MAGALAAASMKGQSQLLAPVTIHREGVTRRYLRSSR